jgi:hypothetical protein
MPRPRSARVAAPAQPMNFPLTLSLAPEARPCSADLHPQSSVKMVLNRAPPRASATYPPGPSVMIWPIRSLTLRSMSSMRS